MLQIFNTRLQSIESNINKYVFDYIYFDYRYKDSVLIADAYAKNSAGGSTSSSACTAALWSKTQFTTMLFHNSSHSLAELIYTTWTQAGSPAFAKTVPTAILNPETYNISVYPNPTSGTLYIIGNNVLKTEVSNITGSLLGTFYDKQIDLSNLSGGIYILSIYGKEGLIKKDKILITR